METDYQKEVKAKASEKERLMAELESRLANEMTTHAQQGRLQRDEFVTTLKPPSRADIEENMWRDLRRAKGIKEDA